MTARITALLIVLLAISCHSGQHVQSGESISLFNGVDLTGWINVNQAPGNWLVKDGHIACTGKAPAYLSSENSYEAFALEFDYLPQQADTNAFMVLHSDMLPSVGSPFPGGEKIIFKTGKENTGGNGWDHYKILCTQQGLVTVWVNGKEYKRFTVSGTSAPRHCSFVSDRASFLVRAISLRDLSTKANKTKANTDRFHFQSLYNNTDLQQWKMEPGHEGHWTAQNHVINYDGKSSEKDKCLWSKKSFRDFILVADVRLTRKPEPALSPVVLPNGENALNADGSVQQVEVPYAGDTGIYLRGDSKNQVNIGYRYIGSGEIYGYRVDKDLPPEIRAAVTPAKKADRPPGEWNHFVITLKGDRITVVLNNETVISNAQLPGIAAEGAIALQDDHADNNLFQFANIYIREL
ncbi:MAG: DUF1080 domain-containing protein [Agriterribacter sp.]